MVIDIVVTEMEVVVLKGVWDGGEGDWVGCAEIDDLNSGDGVVGGCDNIDDLCSGDGVVDVFTKAVIEMVVPEMEVVMLNVVIERVIRRFCNEGGDWHVYGNDNELKTMMNLMMMVMMITTITSTMITYWCKSGGQEYGSNIDVMMLVLMIMEILIVILL